MSFYGFGEFKLWENITHKMGVTITHQNGSNYDAVVEVTMTHKMRVTMTHKNGSNYESVVGVTITHKKEVIIIQKWE